MAIKSKTLCVYIVFQLETPSSRISEHVFENIYTCTLSRFLLYIFKRISTFIDDKVNRNLSSRVI